SIVGLNFAVYESLKDWLVKSNPFGLVQDSELSVTTRLSQWITIIRNDVLMEKDLFCPVR
ncbi:hypothetical protein S83_023318, partial [Arachis hypogaea]